MNLAQKIINKIESLNNLYLFTIIFVIGLFVYSQALFGGFVWDDEEQIVNNGIIRNFSNLPYLFSSSTFNTGGAGLSGFYYKPLMPVSFLINYSLWGLNPFGYHLFSVLVHIINAFLLFILFRKLFSLTEIHYVKTISFLLSIIFLIHPANAESVAYLSSTQELLYTFFLLISLILTINFCFQKKSFIKLLFINFFVLFSLLSKESGVVVIPMIVLFSYLFARKKILQLLISLSLTFCFYLFLRFGIANTPIFQHNSIIPIANASTPERITTIPYELFSYLRLMIFPKDLFVAQHTVIKSFFDYRFYLSLLMILTFISMLVYFCLRQKQKIYFYFLGWLIFSFFILLNIYPLDMTIAERWLYAPMIGFLGIIGLFLAGTLRNNKQLFNLCIIIMMIAILLLSIRTFIRTADWKNNLTLFGNDIKYSSDSFDVQNNLGVALFRNNEFGKSKIHFQKSIDLSPKWWTPYNNLGVIYQREGDLKKAKELYQKSIENGRYYLAYENLAIIKLNTEKPHDVTIFLNEALKYLPYNETLNKIAALNYINLGSFETAKTYAQRAFNINPSQENYNFMQSIINKK